MFLIHNAFESGYMNLRDQLRGKVPENELCRLPRRFDIIGNIAIVSIPPDMKLYNDEIANVIKKKMKNVRTVVNKVSKLKGDKRVATLDIIAGASTKTIHREYGFSYCIDIRQAFFNGRLSFERKRIASLIEPTENVLVPFCGVGPFVVPAASANAQVYGVEINYEACRSLIYNCRLNNVEKNVHVINADASSISKMFRSGFDRAIVPTPYGMDHFLEVVSPAVRPGGHVHFYTFKPKEHIPELIRKYEEMGFGVEFYRRCGNVAPGIIRWVFDLRVPAALNP